MVDKLIFEFKIEFEDEGIENIKMLASQLFSVPFFELKQAGLLDDITVELKKNKQVLEQVLVDNMVISLYGEEKSLENVIVIFPQTTKVFDIAITTKETKGLSISDLDQFLANFIKPFKEMGKAGVNAFVHAYDKNVDYPKHRPPRVLEFIGNDSIIQIIDMDYLHTKIDSDEYFKAFDKLLENIKKSDSILLKDVCGCVMVTWCPSLEAEALKNALSARDDMLQVIPAPLEANFNELGDKNVLNFNRLEKLSDSEYFTYYNERQKIGLKLVVSQNGVLDNEMATTLKKESEKMHLSDDRLISKIILVTSDRDEACAFKNLEELGVYKVFYVDNDLNLWDISPNGNWKN